MTKPYSLKFAIPESEDSEEARRTRKQNACEHHHYSVICGHCNLTLGSELHYSPLPPESSDEVMI